MKHVKNTKYDFMKKIAFLPWFHLLERRNEYYHTKNHFSTKIVQNVIKHVKNTKIHLMKKIAFLAWFHLLERRNAGTGHTMRNVIF